MPRFPRMYLQTSHFHIMTQGINKSYIFDSSEDIKYYIKIMYKLKEEHRVKIIAYCIMSNHAHMLLKIEDLKELSKYMQRLNTKYGKYYNRKYNRVGYVFRDRYKSEGIYSDEQLYGCIKYIYNNPVKAGICTYPEQYPYSNYKKIEKEINKEYVFMDINENKNEVCKEVINHFLETNSIEFNQIKNDKKKLKPIITLLKDEYKVSFRKISEETKIGRETLRRIYIEE